MRIIGLQVIYKSIFFVLITAPLFVVNAQQIMVPPYLQPGNAPTLSREQKVLIWQTDSVSGEYKVKYGIAAEHFAKNSSATISSVRLTFNKQTSILYRAVFSGLNFDESYNYEVTVGERLIAEGTFTTRTKKPQTRFTVFGDCGIGSPHQAQISYQIYQQKPQFALVTGDMVYSFGRELEYRARFFPYYLTPVATPTRGAPLMRDIPFYMILGNHDIYSANLDKFPDGLAYFYYNDLPLNAPTPTSTVQVEGGKNIVKEFMANTAPRFPKMANFSFDYGNVHIACLDANHYVNPLDPSLIEWLTNDLKNSKADWKIVTYHHPGFNSSPTHYDYQLMRLLSPTLEELGVDLVFSGHVHNYQRTVPLKFEPKRNTPSESGRVDGKFELDTGFDGITNTKPNGIIYVVSGAGGAALYDHQISEKPQLWKKGGPQNWAPFTAKLISHIHSFTMVETDGKKLTLQQIDLQGKVMDEIVITKE